MVKRALLQSYSIKSTEPVGRSRSLPALIEVSKEFSTIFVEI